MLHKYKENKYLCYNCKREHFHFHSSGFNFNQKKIKHLED